MTFEKVFLFIVYSLFNIMLVSFIYDCYKDCINIINEYDYEGPEDESEEFMRGDLDV